MTPMEKVLIEVETSFNLFVQIILCEFDPERHRHLIEQLMVMSAIDNGDLSNLKRAVDRTARWVKDYQYNSPGVPSEQIADARRCIEQLSSIIHIGRAYPDKAASRAIKLRPNFVPKRKEKKTPLMETPKQEVE
ncbi:hypothetical protein UFOVP120_60 [uncultured Caudovirales phage]|uniref:Uncharacterized protein n=1 Tax=uncultured Caudovirales phage TaxID=2100421 RepID=A0A6J5L9C4_9CAUD|nr:hypothetical protein UFOVP120_60 [uncultured Caudovirales phage]